MSLNSIVRHNMSSNNLRAKINIVSRDTDEVLNAVTRVHTEASRVRDVVHNTPEILDDLDREFSEKTSLTKKDFVFLFIAIGLQLARQYILTKFPEPVDDQTAADDTWGHTEEHSNRVHRLYNPSLEEIITNPVPFDANVGSGGALSGGGAMGHRVTAIGHDPVMGLIVGTANIATSTLTTWDLNSYHIRTNAGNRDYFYSNANTMMVLQKTMQKAISGGIEGKKIVAVSLAKEIIHLNSDINTKHSLPLPFVSLQDTRLASYLGNACGLNMRNIMNVGKQAMYAEFINYIISLIHMVFYSVDSDGNIDLYKVRCKKIILYSNAVASASNALYVAFTKDFKSLDVGGIAVAIYHLVTDVSFIRQVKRDFIFGKYEKLILGER